MKKIVAAFDGLKYSKSTRDYSIYIAKQMNTHLVGVFMDDPLYTSYKIYDLVVKKKVSESQLKKYEEKDKNTRKLAAAEFEKSCQQNGIEYSIHHDRNYSIQALKQESVYADMIIINANETLTHYTEKPPTRFVRDLLEDAQCPVLIVPQKYKPIKKIVLLFDGGPSSVYAIKMFSYLLMQLKHLSAEVIVVKSEKTSSHLPDNKLMKEFMKRHFPEAKYTVLKGEPEQEIVSFLKQSMENTLVVLGAYRRGAISRLFKESMADVLMKNINFPLFIAHNK